MTYQENKVIIHYIYVHQNLSALKKEFIACGTGRLQEGVLNYNIILCLLSIVIFIANIRSGKFIFTEKMKVQLLKSQ